MVQNFYQTLSTVTQSFTYVQFGQKWVHTCVPDRLEHCFIKLQKWTNITDLTKDLFDKFLQSSCKKFIYMSSVKAVSVISFLYLNEWVYN